MLEDEDYYLACIALEEAQEQETEFRKQVAEFTGAKTIEFLGKALG